MVASFDKFSVSLPKDDFFFAQWKIPKNTLLFKTEFSVAFLSYRPFLPLHFLVCPLASQADFARLSEPETDDLGRSVGVVKEVLCKHTRTVRPGFSISCKNGKYAGQTVKHVHFHVFLRKEGDLDRHSFLYQQLCAEGYITKHRKQWNLKQLADLTAILRKDMEKLSDVIIN